MFTADGVLTIYSLGDSIFLSNVLNGIAMITTGGDSADDRGSFLYITAIGAMFGFILTALRGLQTGKAFDLNSLMLCIIAWYFFFGWNVTVGIRDVFHNEDRLVAHVPGGVALTGSAISSLGWGLTSIYEQAFMPVTAEGGIAKGLSEGAAFADTAKTLNTLTALGGNPALLTALDSGKPGNPGKRVGMRENIVNYINECTMTAVDLGYKNLSDVFRMSVVPDSSSSSGSGNGPVSENSALSFSNGGNVYMTTYDGDTYNCDTALGKMNADIDSALKRTAAGGVIATMVNTTAESPAGGTSRALASSDPAGQESISRAFQKIDGIMGMLGKDSETAQNMMKASIYYHLFPLGAASNALAAGDRATATMLEQARLQRNTQWSSEGTMFQQTMLPIMTFIEGFTYAVTPFMGLFLLLGMFGVSLSIKYFMLVAWVQSWMPCLAIANNYIDSSIQRALSGLGTNAANNVITGRLDSFTAVMHVMDVAQNHIATAGMFIGAIPIITLFIFSGSIYALSSLTSRMNGAEFVNEKIATPDMISPASVMSMMSQSTGQHGTTWGTGYDLGTISLVSGGMVTRQATEQDSDAIGKIFTAGFGAQASKIYTEELSNGTNFVGSQLHSGNYSNALNAVQQIGHKLAESIGMGGNKALEEALGISGSVGIDFMGNSAKTSLGLTQKQAETLNNLVQHDSSIQQLKAQAFSGGLGEAMSSAYSESVAKGFSKGGNANEARSYQNAASDTQQNIRSYIESNMTSFNTGSTQTMGINQVAQHLEKDKSLQQEISQRWSKQAKNNSGFTEEAINTKLEGYKRNGLTGTDNALRATAMTDIMTHSNTDDGFKNRVWLGNKLLGNSDNATINSDNTVGVNREELQENLNRQTKVAETDVANQKNIVNENTQKTSPKNGFEEYSKKVDAQVKTYKDMARKDAQKVNDDLHIANKDTIIDATRTIQKKPNIASDISNDFREKGVSAGLKAINEIQSFSDFANAVSGAVGLQNSKALKNANNYIDKTTDQGKNTLPSMMELMTHTGNFAVQDFNSQVINNDFDQDSEITDQLNKYVRHKGTELALKDVAAQDALGKKAKELYLEPGTVTEKMSEHALDAMSLLTGEDLTRESAKNLIGRELKVADNDISLNSAISQNEKAAKDSRATLRSTLTGVLDDSTVDHVLTGVDSIIDGTADSKTIQSVQAAFALANSLSRNKN